MKRTKIIFLVASIIVLCIVIFYIINTKVSLKYEIEEIRYMTNTVNIDLAKQYLLEQIKLLHYFGIYIFVNIIFLLFFICKK